MRVFKPPVSQLIKTAHQQVLRLQDRRRTHALHDFRVAIRKLRCWLELMDIPVDLQTQVRHLTKATNGARDAEVQLVWLKKIGASSLVERWKQEVKDRREQARELIISTFAELEMRLLQTIQSSKPIEYTKAIDAARRDYQEKLALIRGKQSQKEIHQSRIAAKRLRYLLEPKSEPGLKIMQDILGDLHDLRILINRLSLKEHGQLVQKLAEQEGKRYADFTRLVRLEHGLQS